MRDGNRQALAYTYFEEEPDGSGGVGTATAASLPRVLIMASHCGRAASTTRHQSKPWATFLPTNSCGIRSGPRSATAAGEVRRGARSAAARTVVFMAGERRRD